MTRLEFILTALCCVMAFFHCLSLALDWKLRGLTRKRLALMDQSIDGVRAFIFEQAKITHMALSGIARALGIDGQAPEKTE